MSIMPRLTPTAVVIRFVPFDDAETLEREVEAKALDAATSSPVASCSLHTMAIWLEENGYRWRVGSNGIWERAA